MGHDSEEDDEVAEIFVCIECGVTVALQSQRHTDKRRAWRDNHTFCFACVMSVAHPPINPWAD